MSSSHAPAEVVRRNTSSPILRRAPVFGSIQILKVHVQTLQSDNKGSYSQTNKESIQTERTVSV